MNILMEPTFMVGYYLISIRNYRKTLSPFYVSYVKE